MAEVENEVQTRIERNRQRALALRESRLTSTSKSVPDKRPKLSQPIVSNGGFLLDPSEDEDWGDDLIVSSESTQSAGFDSEFGVRCELCGQIFYEAFLFKHFGESICNNCRDYKGVHKLIARTEAKETYLLKDADLDLREPPLRYVERRNPHRPGGTMMRLYLEMQVVKRAELVWGNLEKIEDEHASRSDKREQTKKKRFDKKVKELRRAVRGSAGRTVEAHKHEFGEETHDPATDTYKKTCVTCGFISSYETM